MAKVCPECQSTKFVKCGWSVVNRTKVQRYRCEKCLRTFIHAGWTGKKKEAFKQPINGDTVVEDNDGEV